LAIRSIGLVDYFDGMALTFHWFLPTYGDSRDVVGGGHGLPAGVAGGARPATLAYLGQVARTAEQLGFVGALTPTGAWCEDARRQLAEQFGDPAFADGALHYWATLVDQPEPVTATVQEVTGAPARTFREWAVDHRDGFLA
jgi:hypothetical protein